METIKPPKSSQKTSKAALPAPAPVIRALERLGENINRARRRRGFTQQEVATRIGASLTTVKRLEKGDMKVPLHFLGRTLFLFGEIDRLHLLLDSGLDDIGLILMDEKLPKRVRASKKSPSAF